jgi:uncharacterized membrane protein YdjX (TVP38/TMEM64 family)
MKQSLWLNLGLLALVIAGVGGLVKLLGFDVTQLTPERVGDVVRSFGVWAPAVYLVVYGQPIVPLPASLMTIVGGVAFGKFWGLIAALTGATLRACSEFRVARLLGREAVAKLLKGQVAALDKKIGENSFKTVLLIRLIPNLPFDVQNYGLGFSRVGFGAYTLATVLGIIPGSFAFVYLGYSLTDPKQLWKLGVAVGVIVGLMMAQRAWSTRRSQPSSAP